MFVLSSSELIQLVTTSANAVDTLGVYADSTATTFAPNNQHITVSAAATTTIISSPIAGTFRNVTRMSYHAKGGSNTLTVQHNLGGTPFNLVSVTLAVGELLEYENGHGWRVIDANGAEKTVPGVPGPGTIPLTSLATQAANTIVANATAGVASPTAVAVGTNNVVGRVAGNIVAASLVDAQIAANTISAASQAQMAANSLKGNATAGAANEVDQALAVQSILLRAAANIVNAAATAAQFLGRSLTGDLSFQLKGLVASNTTMPAATNATTNLSCGGSFTVPANTLEAGAVYRITGEYHYIHTAATTPTITLEFVLGGSVVAAVTLVITPIATASNYTGSIKYTLRCQTTGAGGTCVISLDQKNSYVTFARASIENVPVGSAPATTAINTTISNTIEARIRMTTAVASNTLTVVQGYIEKL